ncbi:hypothetical protein BSIN_1098 [Burkholderia singularis]|uniref:Uncharacterized protein n=1 Tax=Burkholderia singularis TaxID=1503053 RepID=A0A238HB85_9BURK|nr:hypothetical protein BSIN_1098 [Burkholderia singularis]
MASGIGQVAAQCARGSFQGRHGGQSSVRTPKHGVRKQTVRTSSRAAHRA